jgi:hypothetical protein
LSFGHGAGELDDDMLRFGESSATLRDFVQGLRGIKGYGPGAKL